MTQDDSLIFSNLRPENGASQMPGWDLCVLCRRGNAVNISAGGRGYISLGHDITLFMPRVLTSYPCLYIHNLIM